MTRRKFYRECQCDWERPKGAAELRGRGAALAGPGLPHHLCDGAALHAAQEGGVLALHAQLPPGPRQLCGWILNRWSYLDMILGFQKIKQTFSDPLGHKTEFLKNLQQEHSIGIKPYFCET